MGNQFLSGLNKHHVALAESKIVKIPDAEVTVYYIEGKSLLALEGRKKLMYAAAVEKAFEGRDKTILEAINKNLQAADAKLERIWEASPKGAEDLAKIIRSTQKNVADALVEMQKKLYVACRICIEESRPVADVTGTIDCQVQVSLAGKVTESSEAKSAASSAADSAESRNESVDAALKLVSQIEADLKTGGTIAAKAVASLDDAEDDSTRAAEQMKNFLKSKGGKEATVLKASTLMLARQLKLTTDHMSGVHAHVWEGQRRLGLVEKAVKPLKAPTLANDIKTCSTALDKAEKPLEDWLKAKPLIDNAMKPWDGKSPRDYAKLAATLKTIGQEGIVKLLKTTLDDTAKLAAAIEAVRVEK